MVDSSLFSLETLGARPAMNPDAVLQGEHWRIGILTDALVRFEWSDSGRFVDEPTQMALVRDFGAVPEFIVVERDGWLDIDTASLHITYNQRRFSKEGLSVTVKHVTSIENTWYYSEAQRHNLGGTYRTLDEADGRVALDPGVNGRDGWAVIDDSGSNVIRKAAGNPFGTWIAPKDEPSEDFYFFGYGLRYREAVKALYQLTGPTPLLPRFALGNWWSRYHRYTEAEYRELVERFEAEGLPFTTAVIDMDWHLVDDVDPKYGSGWTGYTWNRAFFPDPKRFLGWLGDHGMKTTLNVHPRDGVRAFEEPYPAVAKAVGVDPVSGEAVQFDLTDPTFMEAYFDKLHHPLEDDGVDFWWIDWQQGGVTRQPGLDPLWGLNHLHYLDSARQDGSAYAERNHRPLTFSRYAGPGSHRYPVGFSGDTVVTWESLKFQPEFTATASNIGYGWWSHDIGGHMFGYRDEELEARWYQLGAFSPINRLHSTDSPFNGKEPWNFHAETESAMVKALRLRHALLPYLYTMNWRAAKEGEPIVQPLYWDYPTIRDAYMQADEFFFGTELLVSPIVSPADRVVQMAKADVWLPKGDWFDFFTGRHYASCSAAGRRIEAWRGLDGIPVFARAGAIVPLQRQAAGEALNSCANPQSLDVIVFPGADGHFTMIEDDGAPERSVRKATTEFALDTAWSTFTIGAVKTDGDGVVPAERQWRVVFRGVAPSDVTVSVAGVAGVAVAADYDADTLSLAVALPAVPTGESIVITVTDGLKLADNPLEADVFAVLKDAQMRYLTKEKAYQLVEDLGVAALPALATLEETPDSSERKFTESHMPQSVIQALAEVLIRA